MRFTCSEAVFSLLRCLVQNARGTHERREFIALLAGAAAGRPLRVLAQQAQKVPIVGFLHPGRSDSGSPVFDALSQGLRDAGYVEGETIKIEARWAQGKPDVLPQLTRELIQLHADFLF
jgi:putative tryptophan/tyrosine transport system substrate-binding protein